MKLYEVPPPDYPGVREVLESVAECSDRFKAIYICGIGRDGHPIMWSSGNLQELCTVAIAFQELSMRFLRGDLQEQDG